LSKGADVAHSPATAVGTAVLAVLAALAGLSSARATSHSLTAKNDAILAQSRAAIAQDTYEAHLVREQVYEAAVAGGRSLDATTLAQLTAVARNEKTAAIPYLGRAEREQEVSQDKNDEAYKYQRAHEGYDTAATLFEIAIAVVSISALASSIYLVGFGGICGIAGLGYFIYTMFRT
jgi:hypothetical protein